MIKYTEHKDDILTDISCDGIYTINGTDYRYWDVDFGNDKVFRVAEYSMEYEVVNDDGSYIPEDYEIAYYASYDDTVKFLRSILVD